ncbi:TonB family protein [Sulfurimonas aquatica]|uniref:TonB family protein n=1 Tax=Sulfurimonas aquatica TaxID=2672570 RepID=A0A975B0U4_9BACT|nr:TonB family protein [Sulfurimonas aquatica]QSZ42161.1 TonB family protein [Sulfurimonas aquatica]
MIRSLLYIIILTAIVFIPFNFNQQSQIKSYKKATKSIMIKIVQPKPPVQEVKVAKVVEPKKVIKKKVIKKKVIKKKIIKKPKKKKKKKILPKPLPKKEPIVKKVEPIVEEKAIKEKIIEEVGVVEEEPVIQEVASTSTTSEVEDYYSEVYDTINKNKYYPKKSRRFGQEDVIPVSFIIDKDGYVSGFKILKSSKYKELNKAVKKMFKKMKQFEKPPSGAKVPLEINIDINFKLQR